MKEKQYRLVADFGYGDKTWMEVCLPEAEAMDALEKTGHGRETLAAAMDDDYQYYLEEHHDGDEEDWDWMDS